MTHAFEVLEILLINYEYVVDQLFTEEFSQWLTLRSFYDGLPLFEGGRQPLYAQLLAFFLA